MTAAVFGRELREGDLIGTSSWTPMAQDRISRFAEATEDFQFVHVDPVRAARETPFGGTIAHGLLTLSLVSTLATEAVPSLAALRSAVIVGIDRVRFVAPVRAGRRVRGLFHYGRSSWVGADLLITRIAARIEIEDEPKPALTGEFSWLFTLKAVTEPTALSSLAPIG